MCRLVGVLAANKVIRTDPYISDTQKDNPFAYLEFILKGQIFEQ